jgi:hypothetical protein
MTDRALASVPGYRGWVLANVLSFLEGGHYGADYTTGQSDVVRESKVHLRGAAFGLRTIGGSPGKTWRWYVPVAGSLSETDLAMGFNLKSKTAEVWGPDAKPAVDEAADTDIAFGEDYDSSDQGGGDDASAPMDEAEPFAGEVQFEELKPLKDEQARDLERDALPGFADEGSEAEDNDEIDEMYEQWAETSEEAGGSEEAEFDIATPWADAVFGGERRINALVRIGRDAGGPTDGTVRTSVLKFLRVPFPQAAQAGGIPCVQRRRELAKSKPDTPRSILTGRYESKKESAPAISGRSTRPAIR